MEKQNIFLKTIIVLVVGSIVVTSLLVVKTKNDMQDRFSVRATGKVTAIPDIANITIGVHTDTKKTAIEAVEANTENMNAIIVALKGLDIEKKDITTANYSLSPVYDWREKEGRILKGYEVRQNVVIKIRDLVKVGRVIEVTTAEGANQVGDISFTIDDPDELKKEALEIAIGKAKEKAENLAKISGIRLGKLVNIYENEYYAPELMRSNKMYYDEMAMGMGGVESADPMIEAGEQEVGIEVNLTYEVK